MKIELIRMFVPADKMINDNHGQHYKIHMSKLSWLQRQTQYAINKDYFSYKQIGGFEVPDLSDVLKINNNGESFSLILEHFKCQRVFDLANYELTYKYIIDTFTKNGYFKDDNWKYCNPIIFTGGDFSVWAKRAYRYENDGLPMDIKKQWWEEYKMNPKIDSFIRIILEN